MCSSLLSTYGGPAFGQFVFFMGGWALTHTSKNNTKSKQTAVSLHICILYINVHHSITVTHTTAEAYRGMNWFVCLLRVLKRWKCKFWHPYCSKPV